MSEPKRILFVEDDVDLAETLALEFRERGFTADIVAHMVDLQAYLACQRPDYAVIDLRLNGFHGITALQALMAVHPGCHAVVLTGYGTVSAAVEAMKVGARDFLTKPVSMERLTEVLLGSPEEGPPAKTLEPLEDRDIDDLAVRTSLARNEHEYIEYVLNRCNGNISKAADWLGIHRQSLQRKLKKFPPRR